MDKAKATAEKPLSESPGGVQAQDPTLTQGLHPAGSTSALPPFPVADWDRYQAIRFLGQGGMGQVFLAYDAHLHRNVALKFVKGDDAELVRRLLLEARAQARVEHERVCQVHEVGEVQGKPYIAMQFIDGVSLGQLAPCLTVEQKVLVLRNAAEGVHAAHRAGLIHRDLKPSNILVECTEDGHLKPYVMDFGLAQDWREMGATATGSVLGTPHYMAPEQARGEVGLLDRRTDVYSLGATLYALLTGQPPIPGKDEQEVLSNTTTMVPRHPHALNPDIPMDLEAIALKCLEKERSARYDSVRALIEDLDRFLEGEPVCARTSGVCYRLRKKLRKHRLMVCVMAMALLTVILALGWGAYTRRQAARREHLVRSFTERVERIEALARYSGLSPLHDTRAEREMIRAAIVPISENIEQARLEAGPRNYALGRAALALGDMERAHEHLEAAWKSGFREPRFAYTRALVLGRLYHEHLQETERLEDASHRQQRRLQLQQEFRAPALESLALSRGAHDVLPAYVQALKAFYEEKHVEALIQLDSIAHIWPWFHEAALLRGDVYQARALHLWREGNLGGARAAFAAARQAYAAAAELGQSVLSIYLAQAEFEEYVLLLELEAGGTLQEPFERGLQAVEHAHRVAPDQPEVYLLRARLHRRFAEYQLAQDSPPSEVESTIEAALLAVQTALHLASSSQQPRKELQSELQREFIRCRSLHGRYQ